MKEKNDTQTHKDPGESAVANSGGPVLPAWAAEECSRVSGRKLTVEEERLREDLVRMKKARELDA